jgi:hypothetical protein
MSTALQVIDGEVFTRTEVSIPESVSRSCLHVLLHDDAEARYYYRNGNVRAVTLAHVQQHIFSTRMCVCPIQSLCS